MYQLLIKKEGVKLIDDFEKFLEWRYGVKVVNGSYTLDDGYIMTLALTDAQWERVLSQKDMIQTSKHARRHALLTSCLPSGTNNA